ncbi:MAG: hypothetical protein COB98_01160 [Flavobacteriaceae bacterium]|nr:MAG: hypothetical protein COB98_01160 [Flavobacteriaceae bacterium]
MEGTYILLFIGVTCTFLGVYLTIRHSFSINWNWVKGTIVKSEIHSHRDFSSESGRTMMYQNDIQYTFTPKSGFTKLTGKDISLLGTFSTSNEQYCKRIQNKLQVGTCIKVYYDSSGIQPKSCLVTGVPVLFKIFIPIGVFFLLMTLLLYVEEWDTNLELLLDMIKIIE